MSRQGKALSLCREYDRLIDRVNDLTKSIGNALNGCRLAAEGNVDKNGRTITHLSEAYASFDTDDRWSSADRGYHGEAAQLEILSECSSCGIAHKHIHDRKSARKELGIIKRQMRMIGRKGEDEA